MDQTATAGNQLKISVLAMPSTLKTVKEGDMPFKRAVLSVRNSGQTPVESFSLHVSLGQEGGSVQDLTESMSKLIGKAVLAPAETLNIDIYDQVISAHPGAASKVHMFGYRAVLNWWFELGVWAEYSPGSAGTIQTPALRWRFRWIAAQTPETGVELFVELTAD